MILRISDPPGCYTALRGRVEPCPVRAGWWPGERAARQSEGGYRGLSVRNGPAGKPARLKRFGWAVSFHPNRTALGSGTP